jgi:formylglycine-generating enzyme required for sulfatase activity
VLLNRILLVAITLSIPSAGFAQARADNGARDTSATMASSKGGRAQMGIDLEEIPWYRTILGIKSTELFKREAPKHWASVHDFYIDNYLVTKAQI